MRDRDKNRQRRDGLRVYGAWAGDPRGTLEDVTCCVEGVMPAGGAPTEHQCYRRRGHGPGGLWCKQHDPLAVEKKLAVEGGAG